MDAIMAGLSAPEFWAAMTITLIAGFVKGAVGFAMPLIMISAFSSFISPELALAGLILPTLVTNLSQAFRQGWRLAWGSVKTYHRFVIATMVFIPISAQFVRFIPQQLFLLILGLPLTCFAGLQLCGFDLALRLEHRGRAEWLLGIIGGIYGGIAGVWGPPLLVYLLSTDAEKQEAVRVQGVIFLIGAYVLTAAHLNTGVLNANSLPFSAALVAPALIGMLLGYAIQERLAHDRFRRWTQALLVASGLNLLRRAIGL